MYIKNHSPPQVSAMGETEGANRIFSAQKKLELLRAPGIFASLSLKINDYQVCSLGRWGMGQKIFEQTE
jgi:hypothetical protein